LNKTTVFQAIKSGKISGSKNELGGRQAEPESCVHDANPRIERSMAALGIPGYNLAGTGAEAIMKRT
jgi:hypothetical protein